MMSKFSAYTFDEEMSEGEKYSFRKITGVRTNIPR
jgi:hypothetical protein